MIVERERTLGDILCERLDEEPHAAAEVWREIAERRLRVSGVEAQQALLP